MTKHFNLTVRLVLTGFLDYSLPGNPGSIHIWGTTFPQICSCLLSCLCICSFLCLECNALPSPLTRGELLTFETECNFHLLEKACLSRQSQTICPLCSPVPWTHIFLSTWQSKLFTRCLSLLVVYEGTVSSSSFCPSAWHNACLSRGTTNICCSVCLLYTTIGASA